MRLSLAQLNQPLIRWKRLERTAVEGPAEIEAEDCPRTVRASRRRTVMTKMETSRSEEDTEGEETEGEETEEETGAETEEDPGVGTGEEEEEMRRGDPGAGTGRAAEIERAQERR